MKRKGKGKRKPRPLPMVLDKAEAESMLSAVNTRYPSGKRARAMLELMWGCGLRVSEVVALRPADIRWGSRMLNIKRGKGAKDRNVPFDADTEAALQVWSAERDRLGLRKARTFFCTFSADTGRKGTRGGALSTRYVAQVVKRLARRAGLPQADRVSPHTLRHSFATRCLDEGLTVAEVSGLLGHAHLNTTAIYLHVLPKVVAAKIHVRPRRGAPDAQAVPSAVAAFLESLSTEQRQALDRALRDST